MGWGEEPAPIAMDMVVMVVHIDSKNALPAMY